MRCEKWWSVGVCCVTVQPVSPDNPSSLSYDGDDDGGYHDDNELCGDCQYFNCSSAAIYSDDDEYFGECHNQIVWVRLYTMMIWKV